MSNTNDIWVVVEHWKGDVRPVTRELVGRARQLADASGGRTVALALGASTAGLTAHLQGLGADEMIAVDHPELEKYRTRPYVDAAMQVVQKHGPGLVLVGATGEGREFAASLAAALETGIAADCTEINWVDGKPVAKRPVYGGRLTDTVEWLIDRTAVVSMRPHSYEDPGPQNDSQPPVTTETVDLGAESLDLEIVEFKKTEGETVNLADADVIVAGGRGLQAAEGFESVRELAHEFDGAVGASRAVVDAGWIAYPHQIGQTGKVVSPKLYFAIGISGAIQHLAGMKTSENIVVINKDGNAPIFKFATWGLVGDALELVPKLTQKIRERKGAASSA